MEIKLKKYAEKLSTSIRKNILVLIAGLSGILLLILPIGEGKSDEEDIQIEEEQSLFDLSEYENRIEEILMSIDGVGNAKVMLTLETGEESIYILNEERETNKDKDGKEDLHVTEEYVLVKTEDGGEIPIKKMVVYPVYSGAVVVCDGGGDTSIQLKVLRTVTALTGLRADRISVQKMK